jgi:hypothetical protein
VTRPWLDSVRPALSPTNLVRHPKARGPRGRAGRKHLEENLDLDLNTLNDRSVELYQPAAGQFNAIGPRAIEVRR